MDMKHVSILYKRLKEIYGQKFRENHDKWCQEWKEALEKTEVNEIRMALSHCRKNLKWPPSINEFLDICKKFKPNSNRFRWSSEIMKEIESRPRDDKPSSLLQDYMQKMGIEDGSKRNSP